MSIETHVYSLDQLLAKLWQEHRDTYMYRGQSRMYELPLVPSIYRQMINNQPTSHWTPSMRLRETGNQFHDLLPVSEVRYKPDLGDRMNTGEYLNHLFGYTLGQVIAQQCGVSSECLDVSKDPDVAAFFAVFDFVNKNFIKAGTGVIYRFATNAAVPQDDDIINSDFYRCLPYIDAESVLSLITPCDTWEQAYKSIINYTTSYGEALANDRSARRPIELLQLPGQELTLSRVVQQAAGLMVPDMILSTCYHSLSMQPPPGKSEKNGMNAIEDLSVRDGVEIFLFSHTEHSPYIVPKSPQILFPVNDPLLHMLQLFLSGVVPQFVFNTQDRLVSAPSRTDLAQ